MDAPPTSVSTTSSAACSARSRPANSSAASPRGRGEREGHADAAIVQVGTLNTVERDHREGSRQRADLLGLGAPREPTENDEIGLLGPLGTWEAAETELTVELGAVLVLACDDERACAEATHISGDARGHLRVASHQPEHRASMICRIVATGLVGARHSRPRRHRSDERQASGRCRGDGLGHVGRVKRSEKRHSRSVLDRGHAGVNGLVRWVDDKGDARPFEHLTRGGRQRGRENGMDDRCSQCATERR